jgi:hypothetical protein
MNREAELEHLCRSRAAEADVDGIGVVALTGSRSSPQAVIDRCRQALLAVLIAPQEPWPSDDA